MCACVLETRERHRPGEWQPWSIRGLSHALLVTKEWRMLCSTLTFGFIKLWSRENFFWLDANTPTRQGQPGSCTRATVFRHWRESSRLFGSGAFRNLLPLIHTACNRPIPLTFSPNANSVYQSVSSVRALGCCATTLASPHRAGVCCVPTRRPSLFPTKQLVKCCEHTSRREKTCGKTTCSSDRSLHRSGLSGWRSFFLYKSRTAVAASNFSCSRLEGLRSTTS